MKLNKQNWNILKIKGTEIIRDQIIAQLEDDIVGVENNDLESYLYFNNDKELNKKKINKFLNNFQLHDEWTWDLIKEQNWNKRCKDFFKPIIIKNKINIIPYWENTDDQFLNIKINPALAFGTGHHETTSMMIESLIEYSVKGRSVFDIGAGSGILSIIAKKLGAIKIDAIENDSLCYNNFYENLELNKVDGINFYIEDCFNVNKFDYDVILANLNTSVLLSLIPRIKSGNQTMIISGILDTDKQIIVETLDKYKIEIVECRKLNEWLCFILKF